MNVKYSLGISQKNLHYIRKMREISIALAILAIALVMYDVWIFISRTTW